MQPSRPLFSHDGELALRALVRTEPLFAFDFDGTLAPIVSRPDDARVSAAVARPLARLAERAAVAVVTGRSVADVRPRLGFEPAFVVGNHGAEDESRGLTADEIDAVDHWRQRLAGAATELAAAGVSVEDKVYSLALHYRLARDRERALACIAGVLDGLDPRLRTFGGKCVVNIVAASAPDKADAMFELVGRARRGGALFVGDDVNDEVVFERAPPHWMTVRVGLDGRHSAARWFVDGPASLAPLLQRLSALLDEMG
jgi:trehalose 6-phosphate phosphatase